MRDAVIIDVVRSPLGRRNGALSGVHPAHLGADVLSSLVERTGVDPVDIDDVMWGCVTPVGEQASNIGRWSVLAAGWPETVPATTIDRACGSSQQAIQFGAATVISGQHDIVVAGGVESMSRVPGGSSRESRFGVPRGQRVIDRYAGSDFSQFTGAELMAKKWGITREQSDAFSLASHEKAAAATDAGRFAEQIVPIRVDDSVVDVDEGFRRGGTLETMAGLKQLQEGGVLTAGSSSQISDGAAAALITTSDVARELGLVPIVRIHSVAVTAVDPVMMLHAPISATAKVLQRAGLSIDEIGAFEVNEAFAPVPLAWLAETGADPARLNPNGGAIAIGHPLGCSGARLTATLVHHMRDEGIRYGLQTMCEAGGMANATVYELLEPSRA